MDKNVEMQRKKIYTQNIIRTKHDSAMRYTNNMCNFRAWVWIFCTTAASNKKIKKKTHTKKAPTAQNPENNNNNTYSTKNFDLARRKCIAAR